MFLAHFLMAHKHDYRPPYIGKTIARIHTYFSEKQQVQALTLTQYKYSIIISNATRHQTFLLNSRPH